MKATYLEVEHDLAHRDPEPPRASDVPYHRRGQAEQNNQKVRRCQVHYEIVRDGAHGVVTVDRHAHQTIAHQTDHENDAMKEDQSPRPALRVHEFKEILGREVVFEAIIQGIRRVQRVDTYFVDDVLIVVENFQAGI